MQTTNKTWYNMEQIELVTLPPFLYKLLMLLKSYVCTYIHYVHISVRDIHLYNKDLNNSVTKNTLKHRFLPGAYNYM